RDTNAAGGAGGGRGGVPCPVPPPSWRLTSFQKTRKHAIARPKGLLSARAPPPGGPCGPPGSSPPPGPPRPRPGHPVPAPAPLNPAGPCWNGPRYTTDQPRTPQSYPAEQNVLICYDGPMPRDTAPRAATALPGRQAEAARNDQLILDAARAVFIADPAAPVSEVAKRAGVGIAALYRRYPSQEHMLRKLSGDGLNRYIAEAEQALADDRDPW